MKVALQDAVDLLTAAQDEPTRFAGRSFRIAAELRNLGLLSSGPDDTWKTTPAGEHFLDASTELVVEWMRRPQG